MRDRDIQAEKHQVQKQRDVQNHQNCQQGGQLLWLACAKVERVIPRVMMIRERWLACLDSFPCAWHCSKGFRHVISWNTYNIISPTVPVGKLKSNEAKNLPKLAQVAELGFQPMPETSLFTSGSWGGFCISQEDF